MSSTKLAPSEVLQRQKMRLRLQSAALTEKLENNVNYMQHNIGAIVSNSVVEAVISKSPPLVKSLLGRNKPSETCQFDRSGLIESLLDVLPVFIKGSKGWLVRLIAFQVKQWIFRRVASKECRGLPQKSLSTQMTQI